MTELQNAGLNCDGEICPSSGSEQSSEAAEAQQQHQQRREESAAVAPREEQAQISPGTNVGCNTPHFHVRLVVHNLDVGDYAGGGGYYIHVAALRVQLIHDLLNPPRSPRGRGARGTWPTRGSPRARPATTRTAASRSGSTSRPPAAATTTKTKVPSISQSLWLFIAPFPELTKNAVNPLAFLYFVSLLSIAVSLCRGGRESHVERESGGQSLRPHQRLLP